MPSSNPHGEKNKLQRCCPRDRSLIAAASLIYISLRKGKRQSASCPLQRRSLLIPYEPCQHLRAEEITSVTDTSLNTPKPRVPSAKLGLQMLLPYAVANCGRCRDVSPHFVSLYSLSSKFSSESTAGKAGAGGSQVTPRRWALLRCAWELVPAFVSFPSSELQTQTPQGNQSRDPGTCTGPTFFGLNHV